MKIPKVLPLAACADRAADIAPSHVSPLAYSNYCCNKFATETNRVGLGPATERQGAAASNDATATAVALVLFWPAMFMIDGNDAAPELARLKGEHDAIHAAGVQNNCPNFVA